MKVKELIAALSQQDPELEVFCYSEDENLLPEKHLFRLLHIDDIDVMEGKKRRGVDGVPSLKLGNSGLSKKHVVLNVTSDF